MTSSVFTYAGILVLFAGGVFFDLQSVLVRGDLVLSTMTPIERPVRLAWRHYLVSCGLLLLPIFVWNAAFIRFLPSAIGGAEFWRDIPAPLAALENSLRFIVSALPFLMPLELTSGLQRKGLVVYGVGTALYFCAWAALMIAPRSPWAVSPVGFLAPAYTPLIWLVGLALLGQRLFWGRFYRWWMFLFPAAGFISVHVGHTALVYARIF